MMQLRIMRTSRLFLVPFILFIFLTLLLISSTASAQTWTVNKSGAFTARLKDIFAFDANNADVVGANGTILTTTNGGGTWTAQTSGTPRALNGVTIASTGASGVAWAVGNNGVILKTTNGGTTWAAQTSGTARNLNAVASVSTTVAWAVGDNGVILATTTGGTTWTAQTSGTTRTLTAIRALTSTTAWVVGHKGIILATTNSGATWTAQSSGTDDILDGVSFVDASNGWVSTHSGAVLKTTNGGSTWTIQHNVSTHPLLDIEFVSTTTGWTAGQNGVILKTIDGGTTWSALTSGVTHTINAVDFVSTTTGWVVGDNNSILKTADGGTNWTAQRSGISNELNGVSFLDSNTGWTTEEYKNSILKTTNAGTSWITQFTGASVKLNNIFFIGSNVGWTVGNNGSVLKTINGGAFWTSQSSGTSQNLNSVFFVDANVGWVVGNKGLILKTTDGGLTWSPQISGTDNELLGVQFINSNVGWIVEYSDVVYRTTNGGTTWTAQSTGGARSLRAISFVDTLVGWAVGDDGSIFKTTDGGVSWTAQTSGVNDTFNGVSFADVNVGWAVGNSGIILKTSNGGTTWATQASGVNDKLNAVQFISSTTGTNFAWAVGDNGDILKYSEADAIPPAAITDFTVTATTTTSVTLSWTAPGDDGRLGTISGASSGYDVRYSTSTITLANWMTATTASGEPTPQAPGSTETFTVTGLISANTTYFFAIRTNDEVPTNLSGLSNVPSTVTNTTDGSGTTIASPTLVIAGSAGNTLTFTYTASGKITNGSIKITTPTGWSIPQGTDGHDGFTTAKVAGVSVTPTFSGQSVAVLISSLSSGGTVIVIYGDRGGSSGATAQTTTGTATFTVQSQASSSGTLTNIASQPTVTVNPDVVSATVSTISASPTTLIADNSSTSTITVTLKDKFGNLIGSGKTVTISATGSNNIFSPDPPTSATNTNSQITATIRSKTAEIKTISAIDTTDNVTLTNTALVTFTAGSVSATVSTISASPTSLSIDDAAGATITVTLKDQFGNPIQGKNVSISATGSNNTIIQPVSATDANGQVTANIKSTTAEVKTISATDTTDTITLTSTAKVTFTPIVSPSFSTVTVSANSLSVDDTNGATITVILKDQFGNPVSGKNVSITATGTGNSISAPAATDANGQTTATITSTKPETKTISVKVTSDTPNVTLINTATVTFTIGAVSTSVSTISASPTTLSVDNTSGSTITATLKDQFSNLISGKSVTIAASGTGNTINPSTATTNANGQVAANIKSTKSETKTISATADNKTINTTVTFTTGAVSASVSTITASPNVLLITDTDGATITVTLLDQFGNPVGAGTSVTISATGTSNTITPITSTTDANGQVAANIKTTVAETKTISAIYDIDNKPLTNTVTVIFNQLVSSLVGHDLPVTSVNYSSDSLFLASGATDNKVIVWDLATRKPSFTLTGHSNDVYAVKFSPDDKLLASGSRDKTIIIWDTITKTLKKTLTGHGNTVSAVAFSPDGATLASASLDKTVKLWNVSSGALIHTFTESKEWTSVAFSPDGKLLAAGTLDNLALIWDVATKALTSTLKGHTNAVSSVAFSPDSKLLASGSWDFSVIIWDVATKTQKNKLSGHTKAVDSVAFSPDGSLLASASKDASVILWDVANASQAVKLTDSPFSVTSVAFSPNGTSLSAGAIDANIYSWNPSTASTPTLTQPADGASLTNASTATLGWQSTNAILYEVQLASDNTFTNILSDLISGLTTITVPIKSKTSFWQVRQIGFSKSVAGNWSTPVRFTTTVTSIQFNVVSIVGADITVDVTITDANTLYAYQYDIAFDPNILTTVSVTDKTFLNISGDDFFSTTPVIDNNKGTITGVVSTRKGAGEVNNKSGALATILFKGENFGTSNLTFKNVKFTSQNGTVLPLLIQNGTVNFTIATTVDLVVTKPTPNVLVDVRISNANNLHDYKFDLSFDPTAFEAVEVTEGNFLGAATIFQAGTINNTTGVISSITDIRKPPTGKSNTTPSSSLVTIKFNIWKSGSYTFKVINSQFLDPSGLPIGVKVTDGSITVTTSPNWDVNKDFVVDIFDLVTLASNFGQSITGSPRPNPDVDRSGTVDVIDFVLVGTNFGATYSAAPPFNPINLNWQGQDYSKFLPILLQLYEKVKQNPQPNNPDYLKAKALLEELILRAGGKIAPEKTELSQNFPNPFNPETWIPFQLSEEAEVKILIYDIAGKLVRNLNLGKLRAGFYNAKNKAAYWDGRNEFGERVSSGVYFYNLQAGRYRAVRKMAVLK